MEADPHVVDCNVGKGFDTAESTSTLLNGFSTGARAVLNNAATALSPLEEKLPGS
jgi:hypothetical protein